MINIIIKTIKNNTKIIENLTFMGILQIVRIIIPFIVLPILVRQLGIEKYGLIIFAQSFVFFFVAIVTFGFDMSASKKIAVNRHNRKKVSEIVSAVLLIKGTLFLICGFTFSFISYSIPYIRNELILFYLSFLFCLQEILIPVWFFQGLEKMKYITILDIISKIVYLLLIILFINSEKDYLFVPIFRFLGILIAGIFSIYFIFFKDKIKFTVLKIKTLKTYYLESVPFFYSKLSAVINDRTNTLLIGAVIGVTEVAYYDFVSKIVSVINALFGTIIKVLYPHVSHGKNINKIEKIFYTNTLLSLVSYVMICLFSKYIILFIVGEEFLPSQYLFYILGLLIPLVTIGWTLGDLLLAPFGYSEKYSKSSIMSTILYLFLIGLLFMFNKISLISLICVVLLRLIIIDIYRIYFCLKFKLLIID